MSPILFIILSILVCLLYVFIYSFASFLFNYKIYLVGHEKYLIGSLVSGLALFINFTLYAIVPYIVIASTIKLLSIAMIIGLGFGSYFSNSIMTKVDLFHMKDKKKETKNNDDEIKNNHMEEF